MRVQRGFIPRIDKMKRGDRPITLSDGNTIRAVVFRFANGEREALITNVGKEEMDASVFSELYYKRWPMEGPRQRRKYEYRANVNHAVGY